MTFFPYILIEHTLPLNLPLQKQLLDLLNDNSYLLHSLFISFLPIACTITDISVHIILNYVPNNSYQKKVWTLKWDANEDFEKKNSNEYLEQMEVLTCDEKLPSPSIHVCHSTSTSLFCILFLSFSLSFSLSCHLSFSFFLLNWPVKRQI